MLDYRAFENQSFLVKIVFNFYIHIINVRKLLKRSKFTDKIFQNFIKASNLCFQCQNVKLKLDRFSLNLKHRI